LLREIRLKAQFLDGDREAGFNTETKCADSGGMQRKYYRSMTGFDRGKLEHQGTPT